MKLKLRPYQVILLTSLSTFIACGKGEECARSDGDCDGVPDNLGKAVDNDKDHGPDPWDHNGDGRTDGFAVDRDDDGRPDAVGLDLDGDGLVDAIDWNLDGIADEFTPDGTYGSGKPPLMGDGDLSIPTFPETNCLNDGGAHSPTFNTSAQYESIDVTRGNNSYRLITNAWGPGWQSHSITGEGTKMRVANFVGNSPSSAPSGYPTVYYGNYSNTGTSLNSGLPRAIDSISSLNTGLRWSHPTGDGVYNVAWDIWLSNAGQHSGYFMVWLKDPPDYRPAGPLQEEGIWVQGVHGTWNIWEGEVTVNGVTLPIINYVRKEGDDLNELGFELTHFFNDARARGYTIPGTEVMGVAIGFEIWQGPVTDLGIDDFCVTVQ